MDDTANRIEEEEGKKRAGEEKGIRRGKRDEQGD